MRDVRVLEAEDVRSEFRQAEPLRHLPPEHAAFAIIALAALALSSDHQHQSGVARARRAQKAQQRAMGLRLRQPVQIEPGVDVSWAPTPDMTLNATINPDFSQVETDQAQLNLNDNFALFFPEKRPFFLEGADYFNTQFNVLYTRQVSDPKWGLRATGRQGDGAYGAFVAQDSTTLLLVPGAYIALRRRDG